MRAATSTSPRRCGSSNSGFDKVVRVRRRARSTGGARSRARRRPSGRLLGEPEQRRAAELSGETLSSGIRPSASAVAEPALDELAEREDGQERDDVGERLVERGLVGRRGSVKRGAGRRAARASVSWAITSCERQVKTVSRSGREVPEEHRVCSSRVEGVGVGERVRGELELVARERPRTRRPSAYSKRASVRITSA